MLQSKKGSSTVALATKSPTSAATYAPEARHLALTIVALGVAVALLYFGRALFITILAAVTIAFILEPFVALLMRLRLPRSLASFLVCAVALLILWVIGMGAYSQLAVLYGDLPRYGSRIGDMVDGVSQSVGAAENRTLQLFAPGRVREEQARLRAQQEAAAKSKKTARTPQPQGLTLGPDGILEVRLHTEPASVGAFITARLASVYEILLMVSFVPFLVYFMLSWRDHINRSFLHLFHGEDRLVAARSLQGIADMVRAFVVGNSFLGLFLAIVSSLMFWLMGLPLAPLVGPLSGFLSLVPYIGLPLALLPPLFAALPENSVSTYVLVLVSVSLLHLLALNLLYPKVVGSRVHLNPLVVTFSLMLWGFLWDAPGLVLAIPLTAGLKAVCDNVRELRPIGKFLGD
jgi:predicted PurR-regulated permease PerM